MRVLNLSEGFEPYGNFEMSPLKYEKFIFNGGEPHIKIDTTGLCTHVNDKGNDPMIMITTRLTSSDDVMFLRLAMNALEELAIFEHYELFVSYFPAARQDRVMVPGEPLSAKVYADIINEMEFDHVIIFDPHSDVVPALVDNCEILDNHSFVSVVLDDLFGEDLVLVSPDAGASKKVMKLASTFGFETVVKCDKERDLRTGKILSFEVYSKDLEGKACLIVDDICDGGGTFLGLADALKEKGAGRIYLAVSHGIFSKGFRELNLRFDKIFTTDSFPNVDDPKFMMWNDNDVTGVIQIKLKDVL